MMVPAGAGWEPDSSEPGGVPEGLVAVSDDASSLLLPLLGVAALIGAAFFMEGAQPDDQEVVEEIEEIDEDDDGEFDDEDEDDDDEDDEL